MRLTNMKVVSATVNAEAVQQSKRTRKVLKSGAEQVYHLTQRYMFQAGSHLEELMSRIWDFRLEADEKEHLDDRQELTEAIYHLARARAHLDRVALRRFLRRAIELEVYK